MKNTIIFDSKTSFISGDTLTFFVDENLNFAIKNKSISSAYINKIKTYLKILKSQKDKEKIISFDLSEKLCLFW